MTNRDPERLIGHRRPVVATREDDDQRQLWDGEDVLTAVSFGRKNVN